MKINGLILAAGNSSRLGHPKQLIEYQGQTLLAAIETQLLDCCDQVYVVLGFQAELISQTLSAAKIIINPNWQSGMGSSLACGAKVASHQADGILVALSDQPKIKAQHYQKLVDQTIKTPAQISVTNYQHQAGVPAVFPARFFKDLTQLKGHKGAQNVIHQHHEQVNEIECQSAGFDVDNTNDLMYL